MSSGLNSAVRRPALAALALLALAAAGCTDHGPVGLFSKELFDKNVAPPRMDYSVASPLTFTVNVGYASAAGFPALVTVYLINSGGCPTYGPIQAVFSSADANLNFIATNGQVAAYGSNVAGQEVPNSTATVAMLRGYRQNGTNLVVDPNDSFEFWYSVPAYSPGLPADHAVPVDIAIEDAIGNAWSSQFFIDLRY
jgi:hypothetical protein